MTGARRVWWEWLRQAALLLALLGGAGIFLSVVHAHYPVQKWLFWRYASHWGAALLFGTACLALGYASVRRLLGRQHSLGLHERVMLGFALGVFQFEVLVFLAGLLPLYGTVLFFGLPALMIAVGVGLSWRDYPRLRRALSRLRRARSAPRWWLYAILGFGLIALGAIYFVILSPENVQFDSRWKHIGFAEELVAHGGLRRFAEGRTFATRAHFTSFAYAWALMLPNSMLFDRMVLCGHLEFVVFLVTTVFGLAAAVRRLVPRADTRLVWVVRLLFPGILVYDSSLSAGADHFGAMFGIPLLLLLLRSQRRLDPRASLLLGVYLAAAALVKETTALMLAPVPVLVVGLVTFWAIVRPSFRRARSIPVRNLWLGPLVAAAAVLIASAPHWAHNWLWYGDPLYPVLHKHFSPRPWIAGAAEVYRYGYQETQMWRPTRDWAGVVETLKALVTFSFIPNDWAQFHGKVPVFGSLFTLLIACLPFVGRAGRTWLVVLWTHVGIFTWYWVHHQDRYLQGLLPLMTAATAAIMIRVWRAGRWPTRGALAGLVGLQIVWGGDAYFIPAHAMSGSAVKETIDLLGAGYAKKYDERLRVEETYVGLGKRLPKDAIVLLHEEHGHLGLGRVAVLDWPTWQFGLRYDSYGSPRAVWEALRDVGTTHLAWVRGRSRAFDTLAGDLVFFDFATKHTVDRQPHGGMDLARMPDQPPSDAPYASAKVAILSCRPGEYPAGLYQLGDLTVPRFGPDNRKFPAPRTSPKNAEQALALIDQAEYVVVNLGCHPDAPRRLGAFTKVAHRQQWEYDLWIRNDATAR